MKSQWGIDERRAGNVVVLSLHIRFSFLLIHRKMAIILFVKSVEKRKEEKNKWLQKKE
jgi:hypothetical protein